MKSFLSLKTLISLVIVCILMVVFRFYNNLNNNSEEESSINNDYNYIIENDEIENSNKIIFGKQENKTEIDKILNLIAEKAKIALNKDNINKMTQANKKDNNININNVKDSDIKLPNVFISGRYVELQNGMMFDHILHNIDCLTLS